MGATTDIVARLQLRAEQFSSETGARFAELKTRARSAAQDVRESFGGAFAEVQKLAQTSLQLPRTDTGSLNLAPEIAQLNAAAAAADQRALALRELSTAQTAAAASAGIDAQAMRLEADASAVASLAEERNAQAIRDRITALEAVQRELNQTTSQTRVLTEAEQQAAAMAQRGRGNFTMLGQQFNDFAVQVGSGQSAVTAFVQQFPQAAYAMSTMEGGLGRVGAALTGPFGTALTIGLILLTPFVAKLLEHNDAAAEAKKKLQDAAEGADAFGDAESYLGKVIDLTTGKLKTHNAVLLQTVRLQAMLNLEEANKKISDANPNPPGIALKGPAPGSMPTMGMWGGDIDAAGRAAAARDAQAKQLKAITGDLYSVINNDKLAQGKPDKYADAVGAALDVAIKKVDQLAVSGEVAGKKLTDVHQTLIDLAKPGIQKSASLQSLSLLNGGPVPDDLKPYHAPKKTRTHKPRDRTSESQGAEEEIARINAEWNETPKLIDKAALQTQQLDHLIANLSKHHPPGFKELIADAEAAKQTIERGLITAIAKPFEQQKTLADKGRDALGELDTIMADLERRKPPNYEQLIVQAQRSKVIIQDGMNRPMTEFIQRQRESLEIGRLTLAGRDAEADAMQTVLRLQEQMGPLSEDQLASVLSMAQQHERIARALEDQRRIIGIYTGAVGDLQNTFEQFLTDLDGKTGAAFKGLINGMINDVKSLQHKLLSNALFGGIDRDVEAYIRKMTGERTPAEILRDQAGGAGIELHRQTADSADALAEFVRAVRDASAQIRGTGEGLSIGGKSIPDDFASKIIEANNRARASANDNSVQGTEDIVVVGSLKKALDDGALKTVKASGVFGVVVDGLIRNLDHLGIHLPKSITDGLKQYLPGVFQGITLGQLGGSVFSSITGQKDNKLASSIGGVLGEVAGKSLGKMAGDAIGGSLGKMLGSAGGPIGSIVGGMLGNVVAGLLTKPKWSDASITLNQYGTAVGNAGTGNNGQAIAAATGTASSVASGVNAIADQLGAVIKNLPAMTLGTFDGKYRVADVATSKSLNYNNFGSSVLHDFGDDQQAAIEYAVRYAISHSVVEGISKASQNILASGQDLQSAINKALMIEAVPRDLKAMLDPVGAAIDALNLKWKHTVDALKEGGATAEQMADAERLYNLQLQQTKNSTNAASQTLKDFIISLKMGSSSPYSLRDQEATAQAQLQPFLDQISAGQSVDQDKYRSAAQAYLDIERELYGSTQAYFDALDTIQASTNKAIAAIDNVTGLNPAVESPFAKATADSTSATATAAQTLTEQTDDTNALLAKIAQLMTQVANNTSGGSGGGGGFIGGGRNFVNAA